MLCSASVLSREAPLISACPQGVSEINTVSCLHSMAFPLLLMTVELLRITYCRLLQMVSSGFNPRQQLQCPGSLLEKLSPDPAFLGQNCAFYFIYLFIC